MRITKADIGTTVWLEPYGNNVSRDKTKGGAQDQCILAEVVSMARTRGTLKVVDAKYAHYIDFRINTECDHDRIEESLNAGYDVYRSESEHQQHITKMKRIRFIERSRLNVLSDEDVAEIYYKLGGDDNE